jgi:hypothetical protein
MNISIPLKLNKPLDFTKLLEFSKYFPYFLSELPKDSMFIFAQTTASPQCRSEYSTDRGQLCTNAFVRKYIGEQRGLNKSYENYNF